MEQGEGVVVVAVVVVQLVEVDGVVLAELF